MQYKSNEVGTFLRANAMPIILQVGAILVIFANIYLASLLQPLKGDISALAGRVDDIEEHGTIQAQLSSQDIKQIRESMTEIKGDIKEVSLKLDRVIERQQ